MRLSDDSTFTLDSTPDLSSAHGFTLSPMAARGVIVRRVGCNDKLFQEEDALTRPPTMKIT